MSALGQKPTCALQNLMSALSPNSDRKSRHVPMVMSALPPKADVCGANRHVCFGPIADIGSTSDEHSDARQNNSDLGELAREASP